MIVQSLRQARYATQAGDAVNVLVTFMGRGELLFTATATDPVPHGKEIWARVQAGEAGAIAPYVEPNAPAMPVTPEQLLRALIQHRKLPVRDEAELQEILTTARSLGG